MELYCRLDFQKYWNILFGNLNYSVPFPVNKINRSESHPLLHESNIQVCIYFIIITLLDNKNDVVKQISTSWK